MNSERCDAITDTLRSHGRKADPPDHRTHCLCGWVSTGVNGPGEHIRHQAEQVLRTLTEGRVRLVCRRCNGYGLIPDPTRPVDHRRPCPDCTREETE